MLHEGYDEVVVDELWTFVARKKDDFWVWLVGGRDLKSAQLLWEQLPVAWKECLVFTNAYPVYERLLAHAPLQHCESTKSGGYTSVVQGANNALRQSVSYLGRKSAAFARSHFWLKTRPHWFIHNWNMRQAKKFA